MTNVFRGDWRSTGKLFTMVYRLIYTLKMESKKCTHGQKISVWSMVTENSKDAERAKSVVFTGLGVVPAKVASARALAAVPISELVQGLSHFHTQMAVAAKMRSSPAVVVGLPTAELALVHHPTRPVLPALSGLAFRAELASTVVLRRPLVDAEFLPPAVDAGALFALVVRVQAKHIFEAEPKTLLLGEAAGLRFHASLDLVAGGNEAAEGGVVNAALAENTVEEVKRDVGRGPFHRDLPFQAREVEDMVAAEAHARGPRQAVAPADVAKVRLGKLGVGAGAPRAETGHAVLVASETEARV
mmetsp:Transcript_10525/g.29502  ORF Transcript_10525/g.29502 Transcript_10525/m.29502 type:complete len:301 (-) Transcript_10525:326-1228(-)